MADDWIKMRVGLRRHPKIVRIVSALKADRLRVVGALHAVWSVFDEHSVDGVLPGYSFEMMDEEIGWPGFSQAMSGVGWLDRDGDCGLKMPDVSTHNGASAKRRALETQRKREAREADRNASACDADEKRTREEKRREEHNPPYPPGFARFWLAWPSSDRKVAKAECAKRWVKRRLEAESEVIVSHVEAMKGSDQWRRGYEPAPLTYLNQRRWEDGQSPAPRAGDMAGAL